MIIFDNPGVTRLLSSIPPFCISFIDFGVLSLVSSFIIIGISLSCDLGFICEL